MTRSAAIMLLFAGFLSTWTMAAEAQVMQQRHWTNPLQPLQGTGRFLGLGYSSGYHWRNPGPDVDYYNPYNARNSVQVANNFGSAVPYSQPYYGNTFQSQQLTPTLPNVRQLFVPGNFESKETKPTPAADEFRHGRKGAHGEEIDNSPMPAELLPPGNVLLKL